MSTFSNQTNEALDAVKLRQHAAWSAGDYAVVGTTLQIVGEQLCEAIDLRAGARVLDVAGGNGNASLAAARRWCDVVCTDYVTSLLDAARARAQAEHLPMECRVADAEDLDFADACFDAVLSTFGVMFTPNQERAAAELLRVCKPGGRIGLANWTPDSFIGDVFKLVGEWVPRGPAPSPVSWGTRERLEALFPEGVIIRTTPNHFVFRYRSPEHWIEVFRSYYGPIHKLYEVLEDAQRSNFTHQLAALLARHNRATDGTLVIPGKYLEVVIDKI